MPGDLAEAGAPRPVVTLDELRATVGKPPACSYWLAIDQSVIDAFAQLTGDDSIIHVDPERARKTRFNGTVAHGLLVLSLLPRLMWSVTPVIRGTRMGVNYGYDKVRFLLPVPVDSRIRACMQLVEVSEPKPRFIRLTYETTVELEGFDRPALTARWLLGRWLVDEAEQAGPDT